MTHSVDNVENILRNTLLLRYPYGSGYCSDRNIHITYSVHVLVREGKGAGVFIDELTINRRGESKLIFTQNDIL